MIKYMMLALLWGSMAVNAMGGSWSAESAGRVLTHKGMLMAMPLLRSPVSLPVGAFVEEVIWHYQLLSPAPPDLQVHLCSPRRCVVLDGASGRTNKLTGEAATAPLHLVLALPGKGVIYPPIRLVSQQLIVNYR